MSIKLRCHACGAGYRLRDELAGKHVKCKCGQPLVVPAPSPAPLSTASFLDEELRVQEAGGGFGVKPAESQADDRLRYPVQEYLDKAMQVENEKTARKYEPTTLPLLVGVVTYPWHPDTLVAWIPMSFLLVVAGGMQAFLFSYGMQVGMIGVRTIGLAAFIATVMALAYAAACCQTAVQETADGNAGVEEWPAVLDWKDWSWGLVFMIVMWFEAALFAFIPTVWLVPWSVLPTVLLVFILFPLVYLASLEAGGWFPSSAVVFRSLRDRPILWLLFYLEYTAVLALFSVISLATLVVLVWWSFLVLGPLLAAVMLIESRMMGRLAWCIAKGAK